MPSLDQKNNLELFEQLEEPEIDMVTVQAEIMQTANISSQKKGSNLLHLAAKNGHFEFIKLLLMLGARPHDTDTDGKTASILAETWLKNATTIEPAVRSSHEEIIKILKQAELNAIAEQKKLERKIEEFFSPDVAKILQYAEEIYAKNKQMELLEKKIKELQEKLDALLAEKNASPEASLVSMGF